MKTPKIVSLFSGLGGIDLGFHKAGFKTIVANDNNKEAFRSYIKNFSDVNFIFDDVNNINFKHIFETNKKIDGLVGGPPCPSFSKSRFYLKGKKRGIDDTVGLNSIYNYFKALKFLKPNFFFFENVHGFVYKPHYTSFNYLKENSEKLGYKIFFKVVNSADYGVPQTRERFICIGVKKNLPNFEFPQTTHTSPLKKNSQKKNWVTCGEILSDIDFDLPEDFKAQAGSKDKELLKIIPPGENYLFLTEKRGYPYPMFKWRSRYWSFLLKLSKNRPSWTIQASHSNNMGPFHWKNRFLRISEIKRIQSFPDNFQVLGNYKEQWRQVGNAVPPLLSYTFAKKIKKSYFK